MANITDPAAIPAAKQDEIKEVLVLIGPQLVPNVYPTDDTVDPEGRTVSRVFSSYGKGLATIPISLFSFSVTISARIYLFIAPSFLLPGYLTRHLQD